MIIERKKSIKISLVTGGAGFIGSHVADNLLVLGHKVIILDDLSGGFKENVNRKCTFVKGSITDEKLLDRIFRDNKIDYVFHLAAYAAEGLSHFIRKFNYENNVLGSINLINRAVKYNVKRFVFVSSIAVYGSNQTPMSETLIPQPEDPYGIAKYAIEMDLKAAHEMFGLDHTIFRPHNVYGERQNHGDPYRNVLGIFINNIMKKKPLPVFGNGKQTRAFTYIGDVAPYIAKCVEMKSTKNEIYNIGADKPYTILELVKAVKKATGIEAKIKFLPARREVVNAYSKHIKAKRTFGIKNTTALQSGVKKMIAWSTLKGPMNPRKFKNVELTKNMPESWKNLI